MTQEEVHRKRHSSDEEGRDPGERRQRQRKTGFEGPAAVRPTAPPTQTPAEIGAQKPCFSVWVSRMISTSPFRVAHSLAGGALAQLGAATEILRHVCGGVPKISGCHLSWGPCCIVRKPYAVGIKEHDGQAL